MKIIEFNLNYTKMNGKFKTFQKAVKKINCYKKYKPHEF